MTRDDHPRDPDGTFDDDPGAFGRDPDLVLPRRIAQWAATDPDRPFLRQVTGRQATYGEFDDHVARWCTWLRELGVGPGQAIGSFLPSSIDAHALWLAASYEGVVEVAIDLDLGGEFPTHVLADSGVSVCFARPGRPDLGPTSGRPRPDLGHGVADSDGGCRGALPGRGPPAGHRADPRELD